MNHDDASVDENHTAGDTLGEMGDALKKDAEATVEHAKDAADWAENKAEEHGLHSGDPASKND